MEKSSSKFSQSKASLLPLDSYWDAQWFKRERDGLFQENWIFAGLKQTVAKHNDYLSFTIAGIPIVVRNMKDRLVAFRNVCSHRHSIIHPEGCGNAMFRCPYHGWTYDAEGVPIGIPDNQGSFGFDAEAKKNIALDALALETCGAFIFVRLSKEGPSLSKWLGAFASDLEHISTLFSDVYGAKNWPCRSNWKILTEMSIESYHEPYTNPATFADHPDFIHVSPKEEAALDTDVDRAAAAPEDVNITYAVDYSHQHSVSHSALLAHTSAYLQAVAKRLKIPVSSKMPGLQEYFIYPNLRICTYSGVNACVLRYEPLSEEKTKIQAWFLAGTSADGRLRGGIMWRTMTDHWLDTGDKIITNDIAACEATQAGLRYANGLSLLNGNEERVRHFHTTLVGKNSHKEKAA